MRVVFATPECAPLVKTGGLGDVSAALPAALHGTLADVRVLLPGYEQVLAALKDASEIARVPAFGEAETRLLESSLPGGVPLWVLDCPPLYRRPGGPYADAEGEAWPDNARRFGLLSRVAAWLASDASPLSWRAQLVQCNDWPLGLAPAYLRFMGAHAASLMTVHNLAFQGNFDPALLDELQLPQESFSMEGLEFHGKLSFMKAGLYYADAISTVSAGYAREIQTQAYGCGLQGLLAARSTSLFGIVNGIDTASWDPRTDRRLAARYSERSLWRKKRNKSSLQQRTGLALDANAPLLGVVSRLTHQKGTDLIAEAASAWVDAGAQLCILGSGDPDHERSLSELALERRGRIAVRIGFDEDLAHLIEAGSDLFLMPSRFEPCGMNQMYSQRYGTPPIAHATGGLADTVVDCTPQALAEGSASGFLFAPADATALSGAVQRATALYRDRRSWSLLQRSAMAKDFGWSRAAQQYAGLYAQLIRSGDQGELQSGDLSR